MKKNSQPIKFYNTKTNEEILYRNFSFLAGYYSTTKLLGKLTCIARDENKNKIIAGENVALIHIYFEVTSIQQGTKVFIKKIIEPRLREYYVQL